MCWCAGVVTKRCEMVDFYPSKEEVENNVHDIDYEILSKSHLSIKHLAHNKVIMLLARIGVAY